MKKKIALSIAIIVALLGTVVFATDYSSTFNVSESDKAAGIMPLSVDELEPTVDANTLKNTTVVGDEEATTYVIPEEWRRDIPQDWWRDEGESSKKLLSTDHFQAGEKTVVSDVSVDGNSFYAGSDVTVKNVEVYGDLFVAGKYVEIENVYVSGNIYAAGQTVDISSVNVNGNAYVAGETVSLKTSVIQDVFGGAATIELSDGCTIYRSANLAADKIYIDNTEIGRNANVASENINIGSTTTIIGTLNYYSTNDALVTEGASIGNMNHSTKTPVSETEVEEESPVQELIMKVATSFVKAIIVCAFILVYAKGFVEKQKVDNSVKHIGMSALKGLGWTFLIPIISILLFCTGVGIGLGLILLALYIIVYAISMPIVAVSISTAFNKNGEAGFWKAYGMAIIVAIAITLLEQIPGAGDIVVLLVGFAGMGLVLSSLKNKKVKKEEKVSEEV